MEMNTREYYEVLGLAPFADGAMVDQAYWHLARSYQGLAVTDPRARESLDELNDAYAVLSTPRLREEYDATLSDIASPGVGTAPPTRAKTARGRWNFRALHFPQIALPGRTTAPGAQVLEPSTQPTLEPVSISRTTKLRGRAAHPRRDDVLGLRASTAQMLERWRANANIQTGPQGAQGSPPPDSTLVDIFKTENELTQHNDPLAAVMEILKAPPEVIAAGTDPSRH
jgi:hypothetical protein